LLLLVAVAVVVYSIIATLQLAQVLVVEQVGTSQVL